LSAERTGFEIPTMSSGDIIGSGGHRKSPDPDLAVRIFRLVLFKPDERLLLPKCLHALSFANNILALDLVFIVGC